MSFSGLFGRGRQVAQEVVTAVPAVSFDRKMLVELDKLAVFVRKNGNLLPAGVYSRVRRIDDVLRPLLDFIHKNGCSPEQEHLLTSMITDYIPTPLNTFVALGKADRADDGDAARMLMEQFDTMLERVYDLAGLVRQGALNELAIHTDFIDNRFSG